MLISCPECNTKVSDKAHACPHCGFQIDTLTRCPDCGRLVRPATVTCLGRGRSFPVACASSEEHAISPTCPECGGVLSGEVQTYSHCGAPVPIAPSVRHRNSQGGSRALRAEPPRFLSSLNHV